MLSRRRVVRTAATAAWAVPAIQVATAVPAFAASGCCDVSVDGSAHWRADGLNYIDIELDLANGCNTAVNGLTVTLTICSLEDITYGGGEPDLALGYRFRDNGFKGGKVDDLRVFNRAVTELRPPAGR